MRIKLSLTGRWKSVSICTRNKELIVRYWGGLKFDCVKICKPA